MRKRRWKAGEIAELSSRYEAEGPERLAVELRRTVHSVTSQANRLQLLSRTRRLRQSLSRRRRRRVASGDMPAASVQLLVAADTGSAAR
jgi:hypothetical protein